MIRPFPTALLTAALLLTAAAGRSEAQEAIPCTGAATRVTNPAAGPGWRAWGANPRGIRFQNAAAAGFTAADVPNLQLRWAFALAGVTSVRSQPAVAGGRVFVAALNGAVHALEATTGCVLWSTTVNPPARAGLVLAETSPGRPAVFVAGSSGNVTALDAETGAEIWVVSVSDHPRSILTGTPLFYGGRLYVPISAGEVTAAMNAQYECCTFRGGVAALDAATGALIWRYHTIPETPTPRGTNSTGTPSWGPSGAPVWSSPTLDVGRGRLYIGVGENFSHPTTNTSDAVHALDLATGELVWSFQATAGDAWNMACGAADAPAGFSRTVLPNCPENKGPDFDFGIAPMLVALPGGREILVAGQKAGVLYGLNPERDGAMLWRTEVGRGGTLGGVHWGMAADGLTVIAPVSDRPDGLEYEVAPRPGIAGVNAATGGELWFASAPRDVCNERPTCFMGYSAPATAIAGAAFAGSLDGHLRAFNTLDGTLLWEFDAAREFETVNGVAGRGGAFDVAGPVVAGGMLFAVSGYSTFGQMAGNVLLAFGP